jgi:hypothetical protein
MDAARAAVDEAVTTLIHGNPEMMAEFTRLLADLAKRDEATRGICERDKTDPAPFLLADRFQADFYRRLGNKVIEYVRESKKSDVKCGRAIAKERKQRWREKAIKGLADPSHGIPREEMRRRGRRLPRGLREKAQESRARPVGRGRRDRTRKMKNDKRKKTTKWLCIGTGLFWLCYLAGFGLTCALKKRFDIRYLASGECVGIAALLIGVGSAPRVPVLPEALLAHQLQKHHEGKAERPPLRGEPRAIPLHGRRRDPEGVRDGAVRRAEGKRCRRVADHGSPK